VILTSHNFVSRVNAFASRAAKLYFDDSLPDYTTMYAVFIEDLITAKSKAIVAVKYAGVACDMDSIMALVINHGLWVV